MADTFEAAFAQVQVLVGDFQKNQQYYLSPQYQEQEARHDFIDKFWKALGWDVTHDTQRNPYAQEVKVERGVSMSEGRKRADYSFSLAPDFQTVRFFVEAKKPSVDIRNRDSYFQTIRYGWNGQTPLAVLTDFEQFHLLDCRGKPQIDTALEAAVRQYHYTDYADPAKFGEIYWLLSREAVAAQSLETFAADHLKRTSGRGGQRRLDLGGFLGIDASFLRDLDTYRGLLAKAFHAANPALDSETLTEATQRVLDRLVFVRFLEDKLIEPTPLVSGFAHKASAWAAFRAERARLDRVYNGNIFKEHLIDRAGFHAPDDAVFADICEQLASDRSPYLFNIIPIHILGSIYERFLGNVIVVDGTDATVDQKPEVRKAGGVYYTPNYIVRYIVENTVGRQIAGKTPAEIARLRFADIACGSGSFLLGVYDLLLRYHTDYYNGAGRARAAEARKAGCLEAKGAFRLSLWQKRDILLSNIWGVDIDAQAVEVAQLSLYLKLLEDETTGSAHEQNLLHGAILPTLSKNIAFGNSLIGTDILQDTLFEPAEERKLNPMDFAQAFPQIMKGGGFDAVVGNPPYVRIQGFPRKQLEYFAAHYASATGNYDLYVNFIEKGYGLLKEGGRLGAILPNKFLKTDYGEGLRGFLAGQRALESVVDFGASQVFQATTYTCLLFLAKNSDQHARYAVAEANAEALQSLTFNTHSPLMLGSQPWLFADELSSRLSAKLSLCSTRLLDLPADMSRGSSSGDDKVFVVSPDADIEPGVLRQPVFASDFNRYLFSPVTQSRIIFPYKIESDSAHLLAEQEMQARFPKAYNYLAQHRNELAKRKHSGSWFGFSAPRNLAIHDRSQIIVPLLANRGLFARIPESAHGTLCPMASGGFTITLRDTCPVKPEYVLGLINSRLLFWSLRKVSNIFRGGWVTCTKQYLGELPIRTIDFTNTADKARHDKLVSLVEQMLAAKPEQAKAVMDRDKEYWGRKYDSLDRQIDALVYALYGLTDDEIAIVEG